LGAAVGSSVEGAGVGVVVGVEVGLGVGSVVGCGVVGPSTGAQVGFCVVGAQVVGDDVGSIVVGETVGSSVVGVEVGSADGLNVGGAVVRASGSSKSNVGSGVSSTPPGKDPCPAVAADVSPPLLPPPIAPTKPSTATRTPTRHTKAPPKMTLFCHDPQIPPAPNAAESFSMKSSGLFFRPDIAGHVPSRSLADAALSEDTLDPSSVKASVAAPVLVDNGTDLLPSDLPVEQSTGCAVESGLRVSLSKFEDALGALRMRDTSIAGLLPPILFSRSLDDNDLMRRNDDGEVPPSLFFSLPLEDDRATATGPSWSAMDAAAAALIMAASTSPLSALEAEPAVRLRVTGCGSFADPAGGVDRTRFILAPLGRAERFRAFSAAVASILPLTSGLERGLSRLLRDPEDPADRVLPVAERGLDPSKPSAAAAADAADPD